jgi:multicomponent Na+:H+ antiporter subunit D
MNIEQILDTFLRHSPALIVAIPLLGAFLTPLISKINEKARNAFVIITILATNFFIFLLASDVFAGNIHTYVFGARNISTPLVRILFEVDGLSAFMIIIAGILSLAAVIYSWSFMKENTGLDKFYTLMLLMTAGMLGMMLTGDMFNFFVFLEITSIASCALIAFWTNKGKAVEAGFKYITISAIGALFVLFAIALLYAQYDALNIAVLANNIQYTFLDKIALVVLIAALAMKAGIVPMHMWLPDAYGRAPASVTLLLVGATQASLYGVFRVCFTLYGKRLGTTIAGSIGEGISLYILLGTILVILAIVTILIGVMMALKQIDFKRMIAYAAVAEIGYMFLAVGAGLTTLGTAVSMNAIKGGIFHIINDALDVGLLFLVAGAIYYATKQTSLNNMGGLARNMKYTTVFFLIGLLAVSGMPPLNGFASKILIYESVYQVNPVLSIVAILCSILLLAVFIKVFHSAFLGPEQPDLKDVKEVPKSMLLAMGLIACIIVFFGLFPEMVVNNIVQPAANALASNMNYISQVTGVI